MVYGTYNIQDKKETLENNKSKFANTDDFINFNSEFTNE